MRILMQDIRQSMRSLRRSPGFTAVAILTLALGIGAISTVFGLVDVLFFRPPAGVGAPEEVVRPYITRTEGAFRNSGSSHTIFRDYTDLRDHARTLSGLAAYTDIVVSVDEGPGASQVDGQVTSGNYFRVLGVRPALGRFFTAEEDAGPGAPPAVVIGHGFWQRHFGGDPAVLGQLVRLDGHDYPVVGVAPAGFQGIDGGAPEVWVPFSQAAQVGLWAPYDGMTEIVGRLAPGIGREQAEQELTGILREVATTSLPEWDQNPGLALGPIQAARGPYLAELGGNLYKQASLARWLVLAAGLVLLIACANVANLLLVRGAVRRREIGVRLALGASRRRLVRQLLTEGVLLALAGAGAGLLLALWGTGSAPALGLPGLAFFAQGRVLLFAVAGALGSCLLFGLVPALQASRTGLMTTMGGGSRAGADHRSRLRGALMVTQVALAVVLLAGAGLFVHTLRNLHAVETGFEVDRLLHASVDLRKAGYNARAAAAFHDQAVERLGALPGVEGATLVSKPQLSRGGLMLAFSIPGMAGLAAGPARPAAGEAVAGDEMPPELSRAMAYFAGPDYFRTIGTPIRRGRDLSDQDREGGAPVVVINERFAELAWPSADPLGECVEFRTSRESSTCYTVVGVAANSRYLALDEPERAAYFIPAAQEPGGRGPQASLVIRAAGDPAALVPVVRQALAELDPALPYISLKTMEDFLRPQLQPRRLGAAMFSAFGLVALILSAVGLYGVISYTVAQRTHEMGVRLALGAGPRELQVLVVGQGVRLTLLGLALGLAGALAGTRLIMHHLFGVSPWDPATFAGVVIVLAAVAVVASWLPARRAARVDPMVALRAE